MACRFVKDPSSTLDYGFDWTAWLTGSEVISTSTWTVPTGLTKVTDEHANKTTTIWLTGGTKGQIYTVTNRIVTTGGRTEERSLVLSMENR
jgi:hypothetical protein